MECGGELTSGGCSCSPWGGLLFDPVVQMHMKRRKKRQDPTGQKGESRQKMERHDKAGRKEEEVQGQTSGR